MRKGDFLVALLVVVAVAGCRKPIRIKSPAQPTIQVHPEIRTLIDLVNKHRKSVGCKDLEWSTPIADVARRHSEQMITLGFFDHRNPAGQTPFQRLDAAGIRYSKAAENIAAGPKTAQQVLSSWLGSRGHRRNIEDCDFREHGIGLVPGKPTVPIGGIHYAWTHIFTRPRL